MHPVKYWERVNTILFTESSLCRIVCLPFSSDDVPCGKQIARDDIQLEIESHEFEVSAIATSQHKGGCFTRVLYIILLFTM